MAGTKISSNSFACQRVSIKYKCVGYCRSSGLIIAELNFVNDHDTYDFVKRVSYNSISMLKVNVNEFFFSHDSILYLVQELLAAGGTNIPRTAHELVAHLACRLARWDDR